MGGLLTSSRNRILGAVSLFALACSRGETPSARMPLEIARVAGCYRFTWARHDSALAGSWIPDLVRLDSTRACPGCLPDAPAASYLHLGTPLRDTAGRTPGKAIPWYREYYASHWRLLGPDTLNVFFNSNYTDWDVKLTQQGGVFRGSGKYWSDGGAFDTAPATVSAQPIQCSL